MNIESELMRDFILTISLTDSVFDTTPYRETTFGCVNCAMMAASWRSFTLLISLAPSMRRFTAT